MLSIKNKGFPHHIITTDCVKNTIITSIDSGIEEDYVMFIINKECPFPNIPESCIKKVTLSSVDSGVGVDYVMFRTQDVNGWSEWFEIENQENIKINRKTMKIEYYAADFLGNTEENILIDFNKHNLCDCHPNEPICEITIEEDQSTSELL